MQASQNRENQFVAYGARIQKKQINEIQGGNFAPFWMVPVPVLEKIVPGKKYQSR